MAECAFAPLPVEEATNTVHIDKLIGIVSGDEIPIETVLSTCGESAPAATYDAIDVIYRQLITSTDILTAIGTIQVKGFSVIDVPSVMLLVLMAYNANQHVSLPIDDVQILLERVYNHLISTYNLITSENRADCFAVYVTCLKLALSTPKPHKVIKSCFRFFMCK